MRVNIFVSYCNLVSETTRSKNGNKTTNVKHRKTYMTTLILFVSDAGYNKMMVDEHKNKSA